MIFFAVQKLLSLIRSHLFIFVFIFIRLGGRSKKIGVIYVSVLLMLSFSSFTVSAVTFRSLIHFWVSAVFICRSSCGSPSLTILAELCPPPMLVNSFGCSVEFIPQSSCLWGSLRWVDAASLAASSAGVLIWFLSDSVIYIKSCDFSNFSLLVFKT